jgi:hypothetical protein
MSKELQQCQKLESLGKTWEIKFFARAILNNNLLIMRFCIKKYLLMIFY